MYKKKKKKSATFLPEKIDRICDVMYTRLSTIQIQYGALYRPFSFLPIRM